MPRGGLFWAVRWGAVVFFAATPEAVWPKLQRVARPLSCSYPGLAKSVLREAPGVPYMLKDGSLIQ